MLIKLAIAALLLGCGIACAVGYWHSSTTRPHQHLTRQAREYARQQRLRARRTTFNGRKGGRS